ncbi:putative ORFan [Tupanvirus deep ocean]|uniref:ORFan n=2 Tax=Tupanvirus TaxID=2094720 RepID=A0AC62A9C5_9VIRU|nr:putative ORFan [Tupanvirus deep ocean]QKU34272.1 putative ORFan [Tupanvirus deep ocean]
MGICFSICNMHVSDMVIYNYFNHCGNSYVILYAYSGRVGYMAIEMCKKGNWEEICKEIEINNNYHIHELPKTYYEFSKKNFMTVSHPLVKFLTFMNDNNKPIVKAKYIKLNNKIWRSD